MVIAVGTNVYTKTHGHNIDQAILSTHEVFLSRESHQA